MLLLVAAALLLIGARRANRGVNPGSASVA
jgi:hypothetical protein